MPPPARFQTAHLDDFEAVPGPGTLTWHPVRAHFDVRAFGCNAYSAQNAGDHVVEPHDEKAEKPGEIGHQELYFVATGCAQFKIDDEIFEAPAGTYVWLPDPSAHREAVAKEAGTTVLSFGGPPGFKPSAWEFRWRSKVLTDSDREAAQAILDDGLQMHPGDTGLLLQTAELALAGDDRGRALSILTDLLASDPEASVWIGEEGAFPRLRADSETAALTRVNDEA